MPRTSVYGASLGILIIALALSLTSYLTPRWISYTEHTSSGTITTTLGLRTRCSSPPLGPYSCAQFPSGAAAAAGETPEDWYFRSTWDRAGLLMTMSLFLQAGLIWLFVWVLVGGREMRRVCWKWLSVVVMGTALHQYLATALISYLYDYDDRFFAGWGLDVSWVLATVGWSFMALVAVFLLMAGWVLPPEEKHIELK